MHNSLINGLHVKIVYMKKDIKILFLGGKYFDNADAGGISCKNLFNECNKQNIESYVLGYTKDNEFNGLKELNDEYSFYYKKNNHNNSKLDSIKRCFKPTIDNCLVDKYFEFACEIIESKGINTVVGIFFPIETIELLNKIKTKYKNITIIDYEVDSATDNLNYSSRLGKLHNESTIKYLSNMYKNIDNIFVMKSHYDHFIKTFKSYKDKAVIIDTPFLLDEIKPIYVKKDTIDFLYTGLLNKDFYSPLPILDFFSKNKDKTNWRLHFISRGDCEDIISDYAKQDDRIIRHGYVEYDKVKEEIAKADFLLSIEYRQKPSSIPAKVFNYFSTGKPVIHFCSGKYLYFIENYIDKYELGLSAKLNNNDVYNVINDFIVKSLGKTANYNKTVQLFEKNTPKYSVDRIVECYLK